MFAVLSLSESLLNRAREKAVLALESGADDAIVSTKKGGGSINHYMTSFKHCFCLFISLVLILSSDGFSSITEDLPLRQSPLWLLSNQTATEYKLDNI